MASDIIWIPRSDVVNQSALSLFSNKLGFNDNSYAELHNWSIKNKGEFWRAVWDFTNIIGDPGSISFIPNKNFPMTGAQFFPEAKLNLAENLLQGDDDFIAVIETDEEGNRQEFSRGRLKKKCKSCKICR